MIPFTDTEINREEKPNTVIEANKMTEKVKEVAKDTFLTTIHASRSGNMMGNAGYLGTSENSLNPTLTIFRPNVKIPTYGPIVNNERFSPKFGYPCCEVSSNSLWKEGAYTVFKNVNLPFECPVEIAYELKELMEGGVYI